MGRQKQGPADGAVQQPQQNHGPGWISLKSDPVLIGIDALQPWARFPLVASAALGFYSEIAPGALDSGGAVAGFVAAGRVKSGGFCRNSAERIQWNLVAILQVGYPFEPQTTFPITSPVYFWM